MAQDDDAEASTRSTPLGLRLFALYLALYAGYMGATVFAPRWMAGTVAGINLAIVYGLVLIVVALALALVYLTLLREGRSAR
jgi:uncharacterized membrane protein (DUF485 family)